MRHIVFTTLLVCFAICALAQRKGVYQDPNIEYGKSELADYSSNVSQVPRPAAASEYFSGEFNVGYMFNDHHGLIGGIGVAKCVWRATAAEHRHTYFNFMLYYKLVSSKPGKIGLVVDAGIKAAWLIKSLVDQDNSQSDWDDSRKLYRDISYLPFLYVAVNIPVTKKFDITIGPVMQYSLNNIYGIGTYSAHLQQVGVRLGFGIHTASLSGD